MSYKRAFWDWIKKNKDFKKQARRELKTLYYEADKRFNLYDIGSVAEIDLINADGTLDLYREFLAGFINAEQAENVEPTQVESSEESLVVMQTEEELRQVPQIEEQPQVESFPDYYEYLSDKQAEIFGCINFEGELPGDQIKGENDVVYDISTNVFYDCNTHNLSPMPSFISYPTEMKQTELHARGAKSFSYGKNPYDIISPSYALVHNDGGNSIVKKSIDAVIEKYRLSISKKSICLIPDTTGDFKDDIKRQINCTNGRVVPIPRSVAAAYAYSKRVGKECSLTVYDFDLPVPCKVVIDVRKNEQGQFEYTRKTRAISKNNQICSLDKVLEKYLQGYAVKYGVEIPQASTLISTRDILSPILKMGNVLIQTDNGFVTLGYDKEVLEAALADLYGFKDSKTNKGEICLLINVGAEDNCCYSFEDLCNGCRDIFERINNNKVIWKEYLPELSLEVNNHGRFEKLWLIKKGRLQNILESSMLEKVEIPIEGGTFTLPANVKEVILPLEREEFGSVQRDKKAKFSGGVMPLLTPTDVRLNLSYSFGDPDSYKLTAVGECSSNLVVESEWIEDMAGDNVVIPVYNENEQAKISQKEREETECVLHAIENKMLAIEKGRQRINLDRKNNNESDLFGYLWAYCDNKNARYSRNVIKKFTENINNPITEDILSGFSKSRAFEMLSGFLLNTDATISQRAVDISRQVSFSIKGFLSNLGSLYLDAKQNKTIKELLNCFYKDFKSEYYIAASRCLYGNQSVMKKVASRINEDIAKTDKAGNNVFGKTLRNISGVCWYNMNWILKLYEVDHLLIKKIEQYLYGYLEQFYKNIQSGCDQRKITELRDIVEVAIALCRLREEDKTIFAPEREDTKSLVIIFKEINNYLKDNQDLKMKSRIIFDYKGEVNKVCYLAITMFSGDCNINLLGFSED